MVLAVLKLAAPSDWPQLAGVVVKLVMEGRAPPTTVEITVVQVTNICEIVTVYVPGDNADNILLEDPVFHLYE